MFVWRQSTRGTSFVFNGLLAMWLHVHEKQLLLTGFQIKLETLTLPHPICFNFLIRNNNSIPHSAFHSIAPWRWNCLSPSCDRETETFQAQGVAGAQLSRCLAYAHRVVDVFRCFLVIQGAVYDWKEAVHGVIECRGDVILASWLRNPVVRLGKVHESINTTKILCQLKRA